MKKLFLLGAAAILVFACTPKAGKGTGASATTAVSPATKNAPTEANLTAVKTKYPDATMDQLNLGHSLYYGACTKCHNPKNPNRWDEKEWVGILNEMAGKAKLSDAEKDAVWKYVMGIKLASK